MCGIIGFVDKNKDKKKIITNMSKRISHRGPDGEGFFFANDVALGHRRLSIIDLENGNQPMFNEDNTIAVIFNGEIYNYLELKEELAVNHEFKTQSDTEVLIHGYETWKEDLPKHLRGMFAFAIYDLKNDVLFLAKDHFGIKPLYYAHMNDSFMFASEIKCFLEHPSFTKELNEDILANYLSFSFTPTTETFFKGVFRLDAGCSLTFKNGKININKYYEKEFRENKLSFEDAVNEIDSIMKESVEKHLLSDVEIGSFLSSGIDSSYIVSLAKPAKTYTVGYEESKYNEINYAQDLANKLGIENKSKIISKEEYMQVIPEIMYYLDEPICDPATVSLYFVSKLASEDVKVVLSGEGADEFFGGYNIYRQPVDMGIYNKIPFFIRHAIAKVCKLLPEVKGINFLIRRGEKIEDSYIGVNKVFGEKEVKKVLIKKPLLKNKDITKKTYDEFKNASDTVKMQAIDLDFWMVKDIFIKGDRMTMAAGLEARVPFIDKEVFQVASSLPLDYKVTKENTKVALREAAKKVIPTEAYKKKKLGFPVPLREWMKDEEIYLEIKKMFQSKIAQKFFKTNYILKLLEQHKNNKKDTYRKVWTIYCFLKWYEVYFVNER
ncbi:MAG: asparagine synthase (glutamine-hydrolyzing) [Firmicutes bacterium]|nr:asparagine synthase (glutamine-hydrolyzing) [Bacillota bacterium]